MKAPIVLLLAPVLIGLNALVDGFVMMKLWEWFIAPAFHVPTITMTLGLGFSLIASHLTHQRPRGKAEDDPWKVAQGVLETLVIIPGVLLLVGWLVKTWFVVGVVR